MPRLIWFILTRFLTGFALGCITGMLIWQLQISGLGSGMDSSNSFIARGLFMYFFASTLGIGYMATSLLIETSE